MGTTVFSKSIVDVNRRTAGDVTIYIVKPLIFKAKVIKNFLKAVHCLVSGQATKYIVYMLTYATVLEIQLPTLLHMPDKYITSVTTHFNFRKDQDNELSWWLLVQRS